MVRIENDKDQTPHSEQTEKQIKEYINGVPVTRYKQRYVYDRLVPTPLFQLLGLSVHPSVSFFIQNFKKKQD